MTEEVQSTLFGQKLLLPTRIGWTSCGGTEGTWACDSPQQYATTCTGVHLSKACVDRRLQKNIDGEEQDSESLVYDGIGNRMDHHESLCFL